MIEIQWLASIWRQNDKNVELRRKTFKTTQNYKTNQITMNCIDWMSKRSKTKVIKLQWLARLCQNDQNNGKLQNRSNYNDLHRLYGQNDQNKAKLQKWSKSNDLHRFDVKTIKMLSYVAKHSKQRKTTKPIKLQWIASIGCQNDQNNAKLQKIKSNDLHQKSKQWLAMTCMH